MSTIETGGPAFPMQEPQAIHAYAVAAVDGITDPDERDRAYLKARAEAERIAQAERERIRAEEQAKAQAAQEAAREQFFATAEARMQVDAAKRAAELKAMADVKPEPAPQFAQPQADTGAKITLGQINQRLSPIALSVAGLAQLGIQPAGKDRAAVLYLESDVARICSVLIRHLTTVARGEIKEAA